MFSGNIVSDNSKARDRLMKAIAHAVVEFSRLPDIIRARTTDTNKTNKNSNHSIVDTHLLPLSKATAPV